MTALHQGRKTIITTRQVLEARIERNRRRGARAKTLALPICNGDGHACGGDTRLVVTPHGIVRQCRRCGKAVA